MRILKNQTAALLIDAQERLMPHMFQQQDTTKNIITLLQGLKHLNIPLLVSQQYTQGLGGTVEEIRQHLGEHGFVEKNTFSCCDEPTFLEQLDALGKKFVVVAGVETHVCVLQTVIDLLEKGWIPFVVADCVSSRKEKDKEIALARMRQEGAFITTAESLLFELCRYANNDVFRSISRLVK